MAAVGLLGRFFDGWWHRNGNTGQLIDDFLYQGCFIGGIVIALSARRACVGTGEITKAGGRAEHEERQ